MRVKMVIAICLTSLFLLSCISSVNAEDRPEFNAIYGQGKQTLRIATGSPGALGLLREIAIPFCAENNCQIKWLKRGSGASLQALKKGLVDVVMVHAPKAEQEAIDNGWATARTLLGSNQFYIVGPPSDPAQIKSAKSAAEAFKMIAETKSAFFSRADNSGTHKKEIYIWDQAGINPSGDWYFETHDFMGPTLMKADKRSGYFMTDSSTFVVKQAKLNNLIPLFKKDPLLINVYHALMAKPKKYPNSNASLARKFLRYIGFGPGQAMYRKYGLDRYGKPLYKDAFYAQQFEHK